MQVLHPKHWAAAKGFSNGVAADGRQVFVAGQVGWNAQQEFASDDFVAQVEQALRNIVEVLAEAYSHEVSSCGFWPGNGGYGRAAFYVYAYPEPAGYGDAPLTTPEAFYDKSLGQFILPYDAVRQSPDPDALLLGFLQETYAAAATRANWDRQALERAPAPAS